jgi:hypothetical protein
MSGAWIVDSSTSELIGHIFAVSASSNRGYFIPIQETLKDINTTLEANKAPVASDEQPDDSTWPGQQNPNDSHRSTADPQHNPFYVTILRRITSFLWGTVLGGCYLGLMLMISCICQWFQTPSQSEEKGERWR